MATNMTSAELAAISALIRCQAQNRKKEEIYPCRVLNINDDWNTKTITTRDDNSFEADPIIRNNALASFENDYAKATDNKAFSQSDTGVWNWSANNTSTIFAARSALIGCQASNSYFESIAPCKVIRINNAWNKGKISVEESKLGTHSIIQNKGLVSYHDSYANKQNHKAFVQSDKGIWSWSSQKSSQQIAVDSALAVCRNNNTDFEALAPCKILNVDGKWGLHSQFIVPEIEMVNIKEGCFQMGTKLLGRNSPIDERQHKVCVEEFSIGKYEITQGLWEAVMEKNPSRFKNGIRYPVESITWKKANEFIHRLNEMIGKQYRLPTEAEWEYAARGGTTTVFYTGDDIRSDQENIDGTTLFNIDDFREANPNNAGIARKSTVKVGSFSPNPWGLYDVLGNVSEYTCSKYDKNYNGYEEVCSFNSDDSTNELVRKGGSFYGSPSRARSAFRSKTGPGNSSSAIGFRLAHD